MKTINVLILAFFFVSCVSGKETNYTGSTPAAPVIRLFLGISLNDSVDFIRWKLELNDRKYSLICNYGIGKPNTNGFMNGGTKVELSGMVKRENNYYQLSNGDKTLKLAELNSNLLHLLNTDNSMLVGGGGWSYTLSNEKPSSTDAVSIISKKASLKDSMIFHGRTPCPGLDNRSNCYKLKWSIILYADTKTNQPKGCRIRGTIYEHFTKNGSWKITAGNDGRITYQLEDETGNTFYLLKLDENILVFTDARGNLLVGDHDFSYTLNRRL